MKKKTLALFLALSMVLSMVPTAWAADEQDLTVTLTQGGNEAQASLSVEVDGKSAINDITATAAEDPTNATWEWTVTCDHGEETDNPCTESVTAAESNAATTTITVAADAKAGTYTISATATVGESDDATTHTTLTAATLIVTVKSNEPSTGDGQGEDGNKCTCDPCNKNNEDCDCECIGEGQECNEECTCNKTENSGDDEPKCECPKCDHGEGQDSKCKCNENEGCKAGNCESCEGCETEDEPTTNENCKCRECAKNPESCKCSEECADGECADCGGECEEPEEPVDVAVLDVTVEKKDNDTKATIKVENNTGNNDYDQGEATRTYYLVDENPSETVSGWQEGDVTVAETEIEWTTTIEATKELTSGDNGKYVVVVDTLDGNVVAAGASEQIEGIKEAIDTSAIQVTSSTVLVAGEGQTTIILKATGLDFKSGMTSSDLGINVGSTGAAVESASRTGDHQATITLSTAPTTKGTIVVTVKADAFEVADTQYLANDFNVVVNIPVMGKAVTDEDLKLHDLKSSAGQAVTATAYEGEEGAFDIVLSSNDPIKPSKRTTGDDGSIGYFIGVGIELPDGYETINIQKNEGNPVDNAGNAKLPEHPTWDSMQKDDTYGLAIWVDINNDAYKTAGKVTYKVTWGKTSEGDTQPMTQTFTITWPGLEPATATVKLVDGEQIGTFPNLLVNSTVPLAIPEKAGNTFKGWRCDADNELYSDEGVADDYAITVETFANSVNPVITFTAQWTANNEGGNDDEPQQPADPPANPPASTGSTGGGTVGNAQTEEGGDTTTVEVGVTASTTGTVANATVSSNSMNNAVNKAVTEAAKAETAPVVEIEVKVSAKATSLNVNLPTASLETLAKAEDSALVINSNLAAVALDNTALAALAEAATGSTVTLKVAPVAATALTEAQKEIVGDSDVIDLSMMSNNKPIHDYKGGKITVSLPYELKENEDGLCLQVYYLPDEGEVEVCPTTYADGKVTFTTGHLSMYYVTYNEWVNPFVDVDEEDAHYEAIRFAALTGLMKGYENLDGTVDHFGPADTFNRAQMAQVLFNMTEGAELDPELENIFTDVPAYEWYAEVIAWAANEGLVEGYGRSTLYGPADVVTVEQVLVMLSRDAGEELESIAEPEADTAEIGDVTCSGWAENFVQWGIDEGILDGEAELDASAAATRAQIAQLLMNYCNK